MNTETLDIVQDRIHGLCQTLVEQPDFGRSRRLIEAFLSDREAQEQYERLDRYGAMIDAKQRQGEVASQKEIDEFERLRSDFFGRSSSQGFMEARRHMLRVQELVSRYIARTFELGRVPLPEEMANGCGSGCSCESSEGCCSEESHEHGEQGHHHKPGSCCC